MFVPAGCFFARDIGSNWYPIVATFVRVVGEVVDCPLWDPYQAYGLPLWADPGSQVAYPPTWLNLLLLPHTVAKLLVVGHLLLGGAGSVRAPPALADGRAARRPPPP